MSACQDCTEPSRFFVSAEYLLWWLRGDSTPPLVTTSPPGTPFTSAGVLGQQGTSVLLGNDRWGLGGLSGVRLGAGVWLDDERATSIDTSFLFLERGAETRSFVSDAAGGPTLGRPVFNTITGAETTTFVALAGAFAGRVDVRTASELWGFEVNLGRTLLEDEGWRLRLVGGFRYLELAEELAISQQTTILPGGILGFNGPAIVAPNGVRLSDRFDTRNQFVGGQVGVEGRLASGRLTADVSAKLGLGNTRREVSVAGRSELLDGQGRVVNTTAGGLLALPSNSGRRTQDEFTVLPEFGVRLGYQVTPRLSATLGYTFLDWADVARPGGQVDRTVDPRQLPTSLQFVPGTTATRPAAMVGSSDFWAQGLSAGLTFRY